MFKKGISRRGLFQGAGVIAATGLVACRDTTKRPSAGQNLRIATPTFASLGVRTLINCRGPLAALSGALVTPEVEDAWRHASEQFVLTDELVAAAGQRIASLTGAEWGCVTAGAAAAILAGAAACATGKDAAKVAQLPNTSGLKNECIIDRRHHNDSDFAAHLAGLTIVETSSTGDLEAAIGGRTALIKAVARVFEENEGEQLEEFTTISKKHKIPLLIDADAEHPESPDRYLKMGADLVAYSGGKCLRGPGATGLLIGRKDLVEAAILNMSDGVGRAAKVDRQGVMACLAALELWFKGRNHEAERAEMERMLRVIADKLKTLPSVSVSFLPVTRATPVPFLMIEWDCSAVRIEPLDFAKKMLEGDPRIAMNLNGISPSMMRSGEEVIVADRLHAALKAVSG